MKIALGSDHAGLLLKNEIKNYLLEQGYMVIDLGTDTPDSCDYPDYACKVCHAVKSGEANYGILCCYTGIGMSMAANKHKGIRAGLVGKVEDAQLTRQHNNANVLCLSQKNVMVNDAKEIVDTFLTTEFLGGRHERRVEKVMAIENE